MAKKCAVSGKGVMAGNNVSHAHNKTRRRFLPNLQATSLYSETLGKMIRLKLSTRAIRSIEHKGGLDVYLLAARNERLLPEALKVKRQIKKAQLKAAA